MQIGGNFFRAIFSEPGNSDLDLTIFPIYRIDASIFDISIYRVDISIYRVDISRYSIFGSIYRNRYLAFFRYSIFRYFSIYRDISIFRYFDISIGQPCWVSVYILLPHVSCVVYIFVVKLARSSCQFFPSINPNR